MRLPVYSDWLLVCCYVVTRVCFFAVALMFWVFLVCCYVITRVLVRCYAVASVFCVVVRALFCVY